MLNADKFKQAPKLMELINNETKILKKLNHPGIIKLHDVFNFQDNFYMVYEYCDGDTLEGLIKKKGKIPEA